MTLKTRVLRIVLAAVVAIAACRFQPSKTATLGDRPAVPARITPTFPAGWRHP